MRIPDKHYWHRGRRSLLALSLFLLLSGMSCIPNKGSSETNVDKAEKVEVVNNNNELPTWALWAMGGGIFCFALIIPSPFKFKGF